MRSSLTNVMCGIEATLRLSRVFSARSEAVNIPGALPQAGNEAAPLALHLRILWNKRDQDPFRPLIVDVAGFCRTTESSRSAATILGLRLQRDDAQIVEQNWLA